MKTDPLAQLRTGAPLTTRQQMSLTLQLSWPAIMAQLATIIMQYIDAAMVGRLGATQSAAVGLVASTTWLFGGLSYAAAMGFNVLTAQRVGGGRLAEAGAVLGVQRSHGSAGSSTVRATARNASGRSGYLAGCLRLFFGV